MNWDKNCDLIQLGGTDVASYVVVIVAVKIHLKLMLAKLQIYPTSILIWSLTIKIERPLSVIKDLLNPPIKFIQVQRP